MKNLSIESDLPLTKVLAYCLVADTTFNIDLPLTGPQLAIFNAVGGKHSFLNSDAFETFPQPLTFNREEHSLLIDFKYFESAARTSNFREINMGFSVISTLSNGQQYSAIGQVELKPRNVCHSFIGYDYSDTYIIVVFPG